jgi:hypothetical protein
MRYPDKGAGISPHRDSRRFTQMIAIISLSGSADFRIVADRSGREIIQRWRCLPGDLVLLRGPGLSDPLDGSDPRPLHSVSSSTQGGRLTVAFRMDGGGSV